MTLADILSFAVVAMLLTMTPGPNGVLIAKTVPTLGRLAGFATIGGFVAAFYVHGTLSTLGISVILVQSAQAFFIMKMLGAAYLFWIGAKALLAAWKGGVTPPRASRMERHGGLSAAFLSGFLTNALNPKVAMFYLAAFPQFMANDEAGRATLGSAFALVSIHALTVVAWFGFITLLFDRLSGAARSPAFQRWLNGITGAVFMGFGVKLATLRATA
jgi:threonine/homoserine/homoserine lactone efflux protein